MKNIVCSRVKTSCRRDSTNKRHVIEDCVYKTGQGNSHCTKNLIRNSVKSKILQQNIMKLHSILLASNCLM